MTDNLTPDRRPMDVTASERELIELIRREQAKRDAVTPTPDAVEPGDVEPHVFSAEDLGY